MFKFLFFTSSLLLSTSLFAGQISITATVAAHADTQSKITKIDNSSIRQDIYLKTNHQGLTIALSDSSYGTPLMNYSPMGVAPINFSDEIYNKSTRVGELIISQKENRGSLGVTIAVK
ncbi:hypothetical protein MNB_SV-12-981 [hydrothermal vent metagenome]|uniref:Uncharacterized protein n=1 Tax=hydrothermal vent metagenome TaxID=652676 RepID=A0A1W1BLS5_9ZZZZ